MILCIDLILSKCFCILKIFSIRINVEFGYIHCNSRGNYLIDRVLNNCLDACVLSQHKKTPHFKYGVEVYSLKILLFIGSA